MIYVASYTDVCRALRESERKERKQRNNGGWSKRQVGYVDGHHEVTFREGKGNNSGHTLIADGRKSRKDFDQHHDHYGKNRENNGRVENHGGHRGNYTGPGC